MLKKAGFTHFKIQTLGFNPLEVVNTYRNRLRRKNQENNHFDRNEASYALNESLTKSPLKQKIKNLLNGTLSLFNIGDSLKIKAVK